MGTANLDNFEGPHALVRPHLQQTEEDNMHAYRSHTCGALRKEQAGEDVRLSGWVHRVRDHGGVLFIDLRDHYGVTQVVADPDSPAFSVAERLRSEWVVSRRRQGEAAAGRHRESRSADRP